MGGIIHFIESWGEHLRQFDFGSQYKMTIVNIVLFTQVKKKIITVNAIKLWN